MDIEFIKFPRTPHLVWLSSTPVREDRVFSALEARSFLQSELTIEEKVDGANLGISVSPEGTLLAQNRGSYIERPAPKQFQSLWGWLASRSEELSAALGRNLILFGEWCYAVHSVRYEHLPDWFIGFDIYNRDAGRFFSTNRRDALLKDLQICSVPQIARGHFSMNEVLGFVNTGISAYGSSKLEGLYLRRESKDWLEQRVKIVRPEFAESISEHWSNRPLEKNVVSTLIPHQTTHRKLHKQKTA